MGFSRKIVYPCRGYQFSEVDTLWNFHLSFSHIQWKFRYFLSLSPWNFMLLCVNPMEFSSYFPILYGNPQSKTPSNVQILRFNTPWKFHDPQQDTKIFWKSPIRAETIYASFFVCDLSEEKKNQTTPFQFWDMRILVIGDQFTS